MNEIIKVIGDDISYFTLSISCVNCKISLGIPLTYLFGVEEK